MPDQVEPPLGILESFLQIAEHSRHPFDAEGLNRSPLLAKETEPWDDDLVVARRARHQGVSHDSSPSWVPRRNDGCGGTIAPQHSGRSDPYNRRTFVRQSAATTNDVIGELVRLHHRKQVELHVETGARRIHIEGGHLEFQPPGDVAGLGRCCLCPSLRTSADQHADFDSSRFRLSRWRVLQPFDPILRCYREPLPSRPSVQHSGSR